jgi:hypothetical protein
MRRSTVMSLPVQSVVPGLKFGINPLPTQWSSFRNIAKESK